jgi:uncharacterized membrane protein YsdA (DUF1294 family)
MMMVLGLVYLVASVLCFGMYAFDKQAAIARRRRTPESRLLWAGLLCGWPGGLLAQQLLRHKSSKQSFLMKFWLTVLMNMVAVAFAAWTMATG